MKLQQLGMVEAVHQLDLTPHQILVSGTAAHKLGRPVLGSGSLDGTVDNTECTSGNGEEADSVNSYYRNKVFISLSSLLHSHSLACSLTCSITQLLTHSLPHLLAHSLTLIHSLN